MSETARQLAMLAGTWFPLTNKVVNASNARFDSHHAEEHPAGITEYS